MLKLIVSRNLAVILSIALLALIMFPPSSHAYGPRANWQLGFAGTGTLFGSDLGFWGWCTFTGSTSGTTGDCQVSQYLHGSVGSVQCETSFDITGWDVKPGVLTPLTGQPDFFITSGSITVRPASATAACGQVLSLLDNETGMHSCLKPKPSVAGWRRRQEEASPWPREYRRRSGRARSLTSC